MHRLAILLMLLCTACTATPTPPPHTNTPAPRTTRPTSTATAVPPAPIATATTAPTAPIATTTAPATANARPATRTATVRPASPTPTASTPPIPSATAPLSATVALSPVDATQVANATGTALAAPSPTGAAGAHPAPLPTASDGRYPKPAIAGFTVSVAANSAETPFPHVTALTWGPDGAMYVARMEGPIIRVAPDGTRQTFADGFSVPLGLAFRPGTATLYVSHRGGITSLRDTNGDGVADQRHPFLTGLPCCYAELHQTNSIQFGPDGWLYIAQGAMSDHGESPAEPWHAGILRVHPDQGPESLAYVATGLRNPFGMVVTPSGAIFATDNGADYGPPEELNHIIPGADYGWPACVSSAPGVVAPHPTWNDESQCVGSRAAIATFVPHASANGVTVYTGSLFPPAYRGNLFVALWSHIPGAYRIVRVQLTPQGDTYSAAVSDFVTDLELPLTVAVGPDEALYIADWGPGRIYRVTWSGG